MEITQEYLDRLNRSIQEHLRRKQEDPEYRAKCEEDKRRLDDFYTAGRKPYKSNEK